MSALALAEARDVAPGFHSAAGFELLQREARMFSSTSMVPAPFRLWASDKQTGELVENREALGNTCVALNLAYRMHADPLMVMQNLYIVHGMPAWSAKFLIALFNTCGRFTAIRYAYDADKGSCFAHCKELATGETVAGPTVSLAMAKAEGWTDRKGSKWRTMPEVMLKNRAAAFLIRLTAPELSMGLPMRDEAEDVIDVEAREVDREATPLQAVRDILREAPAPKPEPPAPPAPKAQPVIDAETPTRELETPSDDLPPDVDLPLGQQSAPAAPEGETQTMFVEPKLPIKDAPPMEDPAPVDPPAPRRPRAKPTGPAFNVDAYARRIAACADLDMLTLMRDEVAALPPSFERDDLLSVVDARTRELLPPMEGEEES